MKALVKAKPEAGLWMQDVEKPSAGPNDVLVKVRKSSICGTDVHIHQWDEWAKKTVAVPTVLGHEFMGEIAELGRHVTGLEVGQRVAAEGHITCGRCYNCMTEQRHLCKRTIGIGVQRDGAFAEYVSVPVTNVFPIGDRIEDSVAALFDPLGNAVHAALSADLLGEDVLITGAGPIGAMASAIAKFAGARKIVITDLSQSRLALAKKLGATTTVNVVGSNFETESKKLELRGRYRVGLEMSGSIHAFSDLLKAMYPGGHVSLLGILPSGGGIDWDLVIFKGLTLKGIYGREIFRTWFQMANMIESGLDVSGVITHELPADQFQQGFDAMIAGDCGKVVLSWQ